MNGGGSKLLLTNYNTQHDSHSYRCESECCRGDMPSTILVNNLCQQRNNNRKKSFMMSEKCDEQNIMMDTINPMVHTDESCNQGYNRKSIDEKSNEDNTSNNHQLMPITNGLHENDEDGQQSDDSTNTEKGHLTVPEIIEVLKNLAACKEKLFKWEQSVSNLESYSDSDPNKNHLMEIIDL